MCALGIQKYCTSKNRNFHGLPMPFNSSDSHGIPLTVRMAYSTPPPRMDTKCLFFVRISLTVLYGSVNLERVRKAVKLAV